MPDKSEGSVFPSNGFIPVNVQLSESLEQRQYLCNGELRTWEGPLQDVLSPVCEDSGKGLRQKRIGGYPLLTRKEALEVLDAILALRPDHLRSILGRAECLYSMGRGEEALDQYRFFLSMLPDSSGTSGVAARIAELEAVHE